MSTKPLLEFFQIKRFSNESSKNINWFLPRDVMQARYAVVVYLPVYVRHKLVLHQNG